VSGGERNAAEGTPVVALAALALAVIAFFAPVLPAERVYFYRDVLFEAYPLREVVGRALRAGELPLRIPELAFGQPLLALPAAQVLYPSTWLAAVLDPPEAFEAHVLLHTAWAALGAFLFCRRLGTSAWASVLGGLAFAFCGPFVAYQNYAMQVAAAAWLPWALLALDRALERIGAQRVALFGLALGLQILSGEAVTVLQTLLLALVWTLGVHGSRPLLGSANGRVLAVALAGTAIGAGLAAGFLLPFLEYFRLGARSAGLTAEVASGQSLHPLLLADLALPGLFLSRPYDASPASPWTAATHGGEAPFLFAVYLGASVLALAVLGAAARDRRARVLAYAAVASLLLALGSRGLVFEAARWTLPFFGVMRYPVKFLLPAAFALAGLAALGSDRLLAGPPSRRWARALGAVVAGLLLLAALPHVAPSAFRALALALADGAGTPSGELAAQQLAVALTAAALRSGLVMAGLLASMALVRRRPRAAPPLAAALALLVGADLGLAHATANPATSRSLVLERPPLLEALPEPRSEYRVLFDYRMVNGQLAVPPLTSSLGAGEAWLRYLRGLLLPYENARFGVRTGIDVDKMLLFPRSYTELDRFFYGRERLDAGAVRLIGRLNTRFIVTQGHRLAVEGLHERATVPNESRWPFLVYEVENCRPPVYLAGRARRLPRGAPALAALSAEDLSDGDVVLHDDPPLPLDAGGVPGRWELRERTAQHLRVDVELEHPAALVVLEHDLPGWRATIDGVPARVLGADQVFMAVAMGAGRHAVELRYAPTSVSVGLSLSAAFGIAVLLLLARAPG
jgi:hypothetical protein